MKLIIILLAIMICGQTTHAQFSRRVADRVKERAKQKANEKVDRTIDKGLDKAEQSVDSAFTKKNKDKKSKDNGQDGDAPVNGDDPSAGNGENGSQGGAEAGSVPGVSKSFLDFVPGTNVIFSDNFEQDALMDFPAKWNSTGSGKVTEIEGLPGRWLELAHNTYVNPVMDEALPENCTIEFDLYLQDQNELRTPLIFFGLTEVRDIIKEDIYYREKFYTKLGRYSEVNGKFIEYGLKFPPIGTKNDFPLTKYVNKVLRVSMTVNKTRVRVYLDQAKIVDLPRVLTDKMRNNFYFQNGEVMPAAQIPMYIGNIRIASTETDGRSLLIKQLMDEGKAVTSDILFDVNSDVIKPESYPLIKQFGDALVANPALKIKITGHTDSDGADAANLTLSQKRAAAVKMYITENFAVAGSRIQTDGKGEADPVANNATPDGKAKNRRVEFTKLTN